MKRCCRLMCIVLLGLGTVAGKGLWAAPHELVFAAGGDDRSVSNATAIRVLETAYQQLDYQIRITALPGARALKLSNSGALDGELHRISDLSADYPNLVQIPVPVVRVPQLAYAKKEIRLSGWESLRPYSLAITRGYVLAERHTQSMQRALVTNWRQGFLLVDRGRVDITIANAYRGQQIIGELALDEIRPLYPPLSVTPLYHYLHKKHAHLVPALTRILERMQQRGRIDAIQAAMEERLLPKKNN